MRKPNKEIQLASYNDLLGIEEPPAGTDRVVEVPLDELHPFKDHPFHVLDDEKMAETVESIQNYGVLNPGLVRRRAEGGYELLAGHRRKHGCELAGKTTMPVLIRDYTDDEAVIVMVDSNIQREDILFSEKAFAYKMKMEAMRHQGIKGTETDSAETADLVGKAAGDSGRKVQRYIRLTELLPELLDLVDAGKIKFIPAVSLSYLSREEQTWVLKCIGEKGAAVNGAMADTLKKHSGEGKLSELAVELILCEEKKETGRVTLPPEKIKKYFPKDYSRQQMEQFAFYRIPKVLFTDDYFRNLSSDAKVLYGLMLDRMGLSIKNNWVDEDGRVYIIFTLEQVMQYMNCGKDKGVKILAELDSEKGIGLIQRVKRGLGKPTIIYVKSFIIKERAGRTQEKAEGQDSRSPEVGNAEVKTSEKPKSGVLENRSQEFGKTEVKSPEKSKSGVREIRSLHFGKTDTNNTNYNNTDFSDTDMSDTDLIYPSKVQNGGWDRCNDRT